MDHYFTTWRDIQLASNIAMNISDFTNAKEPLQFHNFFKDEHVCISKTKGFTNFGGSAHL